MPMVHYNEIFITTITLSGIIVDPLFFSNYDCMLFFNKPVSLSDYIDAHYLLLMSKHVSWTNVILKMKWQIQKLTSFIRQRNEQISKWPFNLCINLINARQTLKLICANEVWQVTMSSVTLFHFQLHYTRVSFHNVIWKNTRNTGELLIKCSPVPYCSQENKSTRILITHKGFILVYKRFHETERNCRRCRQKFPRKIRQIRRQY